MRHLEGAAGTEEIFRKLIAHVDHVTPRCPMVWLRLVRLRGPALRVDKVPLWVVGVNWAVEVIPLSTRECVLVETLLGSHAVWVIQIVGVADEEFNVPLGQMCGRSDQRRRRLTVEYFVSPWTNLY